MEVLSPAFHRLPGVGRRPRTTGWPALWVMLLLTGASHAVAQTTAFREYQIKAVFLLNFAQFVEWPPSAFPDAGSPFVIGVLGDDPFGAVLDQTVRGESIRDHPLAVRRYRRVEDIGNCQILFVSASESARTDRILNRLRGRAILTVGDAEGFAQRGGMFRFLTENKKIRLRVNLAAIRAGGLVVSSKLLRAAEIVGVSEEHP